jgi:pyrroloquinoline quinone biosynthesis protein B
VRVSVLIVLALAFFSCQNTQETNPLPESLTEEIAINSEVFLVVLGTTQDAGSPQIGCKKDCCKGLFEKPISTRKVVSLGLVDKRTNTRYLFEATPDISSQVEFLNSFVKADNHVDGVFLTHAHIGHYTGLMYLGKEATNSAGVEVFSMPKMSSFLETNGPWSQLINNNNIKINALKSEAAVLLKNNITVTPFLVPHRDEFSETVGYKIEGPSKKALFIPDIDKWDKWNKDIVSEIKQVDYAFIDATFFNGEEINNRDISEIPHPFVVESMELFSELSAAEKNKIVFIHFNHTNPLLIPDSKESKLVIDAGYQIARHNAVFGL